MTKYNYDGPRTSVKVTRRLKASPEKVFDAWVNPEIACNWLFTTKSSTTAYELDVRVGGAYTITRESNGKKYVAVANIWKSTGRDVWSSLSACRNSLPTSTR